MNAPTAALPAVVIGAGPVGLAAAAHLIERGLEPLVLEAGASAGTAVREWSHVRLFSTWGEVVDPAAEKLLAPTGWVRPDAATYPTGGDWAEHYLQPLADVLGDRVRYGATRHRRLPHRPRPHRRRRPRASSPSPCTSCTPTAREERITARAVIDASGTWSTPSPARRATACPPSASRAAADRITYRVPDLKDPAVAARYAGKRTAVIGSGASAFTALAYLADLRRRTHRARTRCGSCAAASAAPPSAAAKPTSCPPAARSACAAKAAVEDGHADAVTGFRTDAVERDGRPTGPRRRGRPPPRTRSTRSSS